MLNQNLSYNNKKNFIKIVIDIYNGCNRQCWGNALQVTSYVIKLLNALLLNLQQNI